MIFRETRFKGAYLIELEKNKDERGFFARSFCQKEFRKHDIDFNIVQCNISFNRNKSTVRGMHYQIAPHEEAKLVSCIRGAICDIIIDLRKNSATYCQWNALELSHEDCKMLYVPKGFAHGFQTLTDDTTVLYQMSEFYHPESARGFRWDDRYFNIKWPILSGILSKKDESYFDYKG